MPGMTVNDKSGGSCPCKSVSVKARGLRGDLAPVRRKRYEAHMRRVSALIIFRVPLFRLLAINLGIGLSIAALLVGGLLWLDPGGLRHLILADRSPGVALGLLIFGFIVTFG